MSAQRTFGGFERHREHFETLLSELLEEEPDGLSAGQIQTRLRKHPEFNLRLETSELMRWLEQVGDDVVVADRQIALGYLAPLYRPADGRGA